MEKVYITKFINGKNPFNAVGMIDVDAKKLYVPRVSKKGTSFIDVVDIDYVTKIDKGYRCETLVEINYRHYMDVYYVSSLDRKETK